MDLLINNHGFLHIPTYIFECLDDKSLCQSRLVCKNWLWFIDQRKFTWKRTLNIKIEKVKSWLESNQDWTDIIEHIYKKGKVVDTRDYSLKAILVSFVCLYGTFREKVKHLLST